MSEPRGIKVAPTSYQKLERIAGSWRDLLAPDGDIDGAAMFEGLDDVPIVVGGHSYPVRHAVMRWDDDEIEAVTFFDKKKGAFIVSLSERTYDSLLRGIARALFTFLHETGHLVLHGRELISRRQMHIMQMALARSRATHPHYADSEWQANSFASAFAMPVALVDELRRIHGYVDEFLLAERSGMSVEAARIRLQVIGRQGNASTRTGTW